MWSTSVLYGVVFTVHCAVHQSGHHSVHNALLRPARLTAKHNAIDVEWGQDNTRILLYRDDAFDGKDNGGCVVSSKRKEWRWKSYERCTMRIKKYVSGPGAQGG